jgi:hypothetical protein
VRKQPNGNRQRPMAGFTHHLTKYLRISVETAI